MAAALAALIVTVAVLAAAVDAGYFRGPLIRILAAHMGRPIRIDGPIEAHIFSLNPRVIAQRVTIGNPSWMPAGLTAEIGKLSLVIALPRFGRSFGIEKLDIEAATLRLARDPTGHANWQLTDPDKGKGAGLPIIHSLSMLDAHVYLDDARRHLRFDGTVSAHDASGVEGAQPFRIEGAGQLNGRAASFEISGDPLGGVSRDSPYRFVFAERSSGSQLRGRGFLLRPFKLDALDATFDAAGANLKDLYFLTGVTLINTGSYNLSGKLSRRELQFDFSDIVATSGESDVRGHVSIDTSSGRRKLDADFNSQFLRLADLGARAAARGSEPQTGTPPDTATPFLLSDAMLSSGAVRRGDALVSFHARRVDVGRVSLRMVAVKMSIDHGILALTPLQADVLDGKLTAFITVDATGENPAVAADLRFTGLQLAELDHKGTGPPRFEGLLGARITVTGQGRSIHQVAATANGTVTAVLPHGTIRASLAELTGIDLRGLGLAMTKNVRETGIRCGVASFQAQRGILTVQSLIVDTDPVLITGEGAVHLDSEALDLAFRGHPKSMRLLRIRSPVLVRGTLTHPAIDVQARHSIAQAAEAVALGVVLTPLAAVLAFVDPGLAKDADCAALLATANSNDAHVNAHLVRRDGSELFPTITTASSRLRRGMP
jgi:uncharacterized protein involved in outer membrane biogenesis